MKPYYSDPLVTLYVGDCLDVLPTLEADSVDAIVTDPPAGISFMSKHWDRDKGGRTAWVEWMTQVMRECYRVTKPGGYAVVWSIPRTCHWTGWAIEDAGFIIRDQLAHIFASGFPKGKAQLKPAREDWWLARKPGPLRPLAIDECRIPTGDSLGGGAEKRVAVDGKHDGWERPWMHDPAAVEAHTSRIRANVAKAESLGRWPSNTLLSDPQLFDDANPFVVGSGATSAVGDVRPYDRANRNSYSGGMPEHSTFERAGDSGGYSRFFIIPKADRAERERGLAGATQHETMYRTLPDPRMDRPQERTARANVHPTVKPIDLMRHLVRLVTPPGGVTLDPFLGSGTTALAASEEGFRCIGIEREAEYLEIAKGRLMATPMGLGLDVPAGQKRPPKTHPDLSKHQPKRRAPSENYTGGWAGTEEDDPAA